MISLQKHIPNGLSVVRAGLTVALLCLFVIPHTVVAAQIIIVLAIISDKLDGSLARAWKVESELGKRLESVVDPAFTFTAVVYAVVFLGLPVYPFVIGAVLAIIGNGGRLLIWLKTKKLFYQKSPLTRYAVGVLYVVILLYVFSVPYREYLLWPTVAYGIIVWINYMRMMLQSKNHAQG